MANVFADYSNNVIYKITCKDENVRDVYIGHTTSFYQRERLHKSNCNNVNAKGYNYRVYKIIRENGGWNNWTMDIIEKYPCEDIEQAKERERYWMEILTSTLNVTIPNRSRKEYSQIYRLIHKEELAEKAKNYRTENKEKIRDYIDANKEKIAIQKKDWYEEHKPEILEKAKAHYEENKSDKLEYQKQYAEEHKEQLSEYRKEYREKNKEKLSEQKKLYREEHKEEAKIKHKEWRKTNKEAIKAKRSQVIVCDCGHTYTFGNKIRHLQSKHHVNYQDALMNPKSENELNQIKEQTEEEEEKEKLSKLRETQRLYRETHAEQIKNYKKTHYQLHKEEIAEQYKKYREEHKEEIKEQQKKYVEYNKEKIKERKNSWYEKNKERILEKGKEMFVCECGAEIRQAGKREHFKSTKHQNYVTSLQPEASPILMPII